MKVMVLAVAFALFCAILPLSAQALIQHYQLNIPRQPLDTALKDFAHQTRLQVARFADRVDGGVIVGPLSGELSADDALKSLLEPQGLSYKMVNEKTIVIVKLRAEPAATTRSKDQGDSETKGKEASKEETESTNLWNQFRVAQATQGSNRTSSSTVKGDTTPSNQNLDTSSGSEVRLQEITVTAEKRSERLQDVPSSVSALTGLTLEAMGAESFTDYARSIPGLTFQDLGAGREVPTIRGINPSGGAAAVSYYIGETPMPNGVLSGGQAVNPALIDIDRIEVLRGPQGTLYGSSSIGGTIKLIPHEPDLNQFEGSVKGETFVTQGQDGASPGEQTELILNVPIVKGTAAVRGAFWERDAGGFITRTWSNAGDLGIATGAPVGKVGNLPDEHTWGLRTSLLYQPSDQFSVSAMAYVQHQHFDGFTDITVDSSNPSGRLVQNLISDVPEPQDERFELYNLTAKYDPGRFSVVSSTSYSNQLHNITEEATSLAQLLPLFVPPPQGPLPPSAAAFPTAVDDGPITVYDFTQETRVATSERIVGFDGLIGVFYSRIHSPVVGAWVSPQYNALVAGGNPASPLYAPDNNLITDREVRRERETSEFGELTYHFTDSLSLTGGLRHYDVMTADDTLQSGWLIGLNTPGVTSETHTASDAKGLVYKGNLSYKLTSDHLLYAQFTEGFRPGFGNPAVPAAFLSPCNITSNDFRDVKPDSIKSYELGAKTDWLDRRLTINAAAYRINWTDIQQSTLLPCGYTISANFGSASVSGGELEASARVTHRVTAGLSATYERTQLQQDEILPSGLTEMRGDPIQQVPRWQYAVFAQTTWPLLRTDDGFLRVDYQYTGSSLGDYSRLSDGSFDPSHEVQVVRMLNLRTGLHYNAWEFVLSGTNLLNNTARQSVDPWAGVTSVIPGRLRYVITRPRTFFLSASYGF